MNLYIKKNDPATIALIHEFLHSTDLLGAFRNHIKIRAIVVHLSRPGDIHHNQTFADIDYKTKLLNLHCDPKPGVIKALIYLDEVNEQNGPFQAVIGSNKWVRDEIEQIFAWGNSIGNYCHTPAHREVACAFPRRFRKNAIMGKLIPDESRMSNFLLENLTSFTTDMANVIFFDPNFLLHRGGLVDEGERINLQVIMGRT